MKSGAQKTLTAVIKPYVQRAFLNDTKAAHLWLEMMRKEPLLNDLCETPQGPPFHSEGVWVSDHIRLLLEVYDGILMGEWSVTDLVEVAEAPDLLEVFIGMEEWLRAHRPFLETFILTHDAGKTVTFGVWTENDLPPLHPLDRDPKLDSRQEMTEKVRLYIKDHPNKTSHEQSIGFFLESGLHFSFHGHHLVAQAPPFRALIDRVAADRAVPSHELALLHDVIYLHQEFVSQQARGQTWSLKRVEVISERHGMGVLECLDALQAVLFLDVACGSVQWSKERGVFNDLSLVISSFTQERLTFPTLFEKEQRAKEDQKKRAWQALFRAYGLDGAALLELLGIAPGPEFGRFLTALQTAVKEETDLPSYRSDIDPIVRERATQLTLNRGSL